MDKQFPSSLADPWCTGVSQPLEFDLGHAGILATNGQWRVLRAAAIDVATRAALQG